MLWKSQGIIINLLISLNSKYAKENKEKLI